jgi:carboxypeptidase family protein
MSLRRRAVITASFLLLLASSAPQLFAQTGGDVLVVEVMNAEDRPLKNACVTVIPKEGEITFRKADKNGRVRLKGITPGSYRVVVKVDGYTAQKKQVSVGTTLETVAFSLQPRGVGEE